ncbi:MAG: hypothetical protein JSW52_10995 [Candidatus Coatesbacteria bacterium]|nr:MAG: hypothetical protein JSW52_10995 [Candidatus Coatesbacteria bacterium]
MTDEERDERDVANIVAVIFPQSGGYMARLMPIGIDCYSETLDGLHEEISKVIKDYQEYIENVDFDEWYEEGTEFALFGERLPGGKGSYFVEPFDDWLH